jgi:hypothetical protein
MKVKRVLKTKYRRILQGIGIVTLLFIIGIILEKACVQRPKKGSRNGEEPIEVVIGHNKIVGVASCRKEFNDSNNVQIVAAERYGVKPVQNRHEADSLKDVLILLEDSGVYVIDSLAHSIPYLTFGAKEVLDKIAVNFRDSLYSKGCVPCRLVVTSVLRTKDDVAVLRRRNVNATANSTHCYGTTFDIAYGRYETSPAPKPEGLRALEPWEMKKVLSEVLRDLRNEGYCYVKYEFKQPCFHITARR